jgi:hypothetical protein
MRVLSLFHRQYNEEGFMRFVPSRRAIQMKANIRFLDIPLLSFHRMRLSVYTSSELSVYSTVINTASLLGLCIHFRKRKIKKKHPAY